MKRTIFILIPIFLLVTSFRNPAPKDSTKNILPTYKPIADLAFQSGEELVYSLHYGFVTGGSATITLNQTQLAGVDVLHAVAKARTTGITDKVFRVLDVYESYFNMNTNLPVFSIRNISEGNYKNFTEIYFNHDSNTIKSSKSGLHKVPDNTIDMLCSLFYIRRIDFSKFKGGEIVSVITYFGDELFPFYIVFKGREVVKNSKGKFKCLKFIPIVEPGRIFKENDDMTIWLSDDENKIPIQVKFDMIVGSFKCDLESHKNLRFDLTSKISK